MSIQNIIARLQFWRCKRSYMFHFVWIHPRGTMVFGSMKMDFARLGSAQVKKAEAFLKEVFEGNTPAIISVTPLDEYTVNKEPSSVKEGC